MLNVILYNFNKKENSTKRPTNLTGSTFPCLIKDIDSILTPVIELDETAANSSIPLFNYAFIPSFRRYYFIDDISFSLGTWSISMHVDVLATYAADIFNSRQYVARSATEFDLTIPDTAYLTKAYNYNSEYEEEHYAGTINGQNNVWSRYVGTNQYTDGPYFKVPIESGCFVVGIVGSNTTGVNYYWFDNDGFQEFINEAMTFTPSDMQDVSSGVANAVFNPLQYITSVRWFPEHPYLRNDQIANPLTKIAIGGYKIPLNGNFTYGGYEVNINVLTDFRLQIDIPKHPQSSAKPFMDLSPFTQLNLVFQPFGCIPLDTTKLLNSSSVTVQWIVDYCGGSCVMNVYRSGNTLWTPEGLLYTTSTDYGVQLPVSSLVMDWKGGLAISALSWLKETTGDFFGGSSSKSFSSSESKSLRGGSGAPSPTGSSRDITPRTEENVNVLDRAMDLTAAALGQISTVGSVGSFLSYMQDPPYIMAWFRDTVEEDVPRFGRPLYKVKKLDSLRGFTLCMNATMNFNDPTVNPTADEQAAILASLNSGFYLEV